MESVLEEWSRSTHFQGMTITAGVVALLESGHLMESGCVKEKGKVISWSMEVETITEMEQLELERKELFNCLVDLLHSEIDTRENLKCFAT